MGEMLPTQAQDAARQPQSMGLEADENCLENVDTAEVAQLDFLALMPTGSDDVSRGDCTYEGFAALNSGRFSDETGACGMYEVELPADYQEVIRPLPEVQFEAGGSLVGNMDEDEDEEVALPIQYQGISKLLPTMQLEADEDMFVEVPQIQNFVETRSADYTDDWVLA